MPNLGADERTGRGYGVGRSAQLWHPIAIQHHGVAVNAASGEMAQWETVVMATPPRATSLCKSISASLTSPRGITPSKVADLMKRFFRVRGPRRNGVAAFVVGDDGSARVEHPTQDVDQRARLVALDGVARILDDLRGAELLCATA